MAFSSVTIGSGAASKSWFGYDEHRTQNSISITSNSAHLSPSTGTMLCQSESINSSVSGGSMRYYLADSGGGSMVDSGTFDPSGTGDTSSARYSVTADVAKNLVAGTSYWIGLIEKSATAVGFLTTTSGSTTRKDASWDTQYTWGGTAYFKMYYNTVPSKPQTPSATSGTNIGDVNLSWTAPSSNGGLDVNGYKIEWSLTSNFASIAGSIADTGSTTTSQTINRATHGLTPGTTYYFRVAALNPVTDSWGGGASSPYSDTVSALAKPIGRRWTGSAETPIVTAMRWDGSAEVPITVMKRWNGTAEVDLS